MQIISSPLGKVKFEENRGHFENQKSILEDACALCSVNSLSNHDISTSGGVHIYFNKNTNERTLFENIYL